MDKNIAKLLAYGGAGLLIGTAITYGGINIGLNGQEMQANAKEIKDACVLEYIENNYTTDEVGNKASVLLQKYQDGEITVTKLEDEFANLFNLEDIKEDIASGNDEVSKEYLDAESNGRVGVFSEAFGNTLGVIGVLTAVLMSGGAGMCIIEELKKRAKAKQEREESNNPIKENDEKTAGIKSSASEVVLRRDELLEGKDREQIATEYLVELNKKKEMAKQYYEICDYLGLPRDPNVKKWVDEEYDEGFRNKSNKESENKSVAENLIDVEDVME